MYGAGFDGEGDGFGLLAAAGAHQAGGPARLPAGGAVPAPMQAHGQPEVVILQATEVGGDSPLPAALAAEEDLALEDDADDSQQATATAAGAAGGVAAYTVSVCTPSFQYKDLEYRNMQ